MPLSHAVKKKHQDDVVPVNPRLSYSDRRLEPPKYKLPDHGLEATAAYQTIHDELMLDGNARLNLATFVTTWMPPIADQLMTECADKNMIDKDEYPQTAEIEKRCVNILARLWNAREGAATGCSTTGSSEAAMLCGLAMKWQWRKRMQQAGKSTGKPNIVLGTNVQVCWEKFCRYFEVEPKYVPVERGRYHLTAEEAIKHCDENTIGVVAILGSTFDGSYEPVAEISKALDKLEADGGPSIPIHVDAASGGFIAPFIQPELEWDFRVPRVCSINSSGHKYGLVYPGVGWALWRDSEALPDELIFNVDYLGGEMPTFALNFSRPGSQVVLQYYNFLRLGYEGYRNVQQTSQDVAMHLSSKIGAMEHFELITDGSELPVFAFKLRDGIENYSEFHLSAVLRRHGWLIPSYTMPENCKDMSILRIVVRAGFSHDLADMLLEDMQGELSYLDQLKTPLPPRPEQQFCH